MKTTGGKVRRTEDNLGTAWMRRERAGLSSLLAACSLLLAPAAARAGVEAVTVRLEEARCFS